MNQVYKYTILQRALIVIAMVLLTMQPYAQSTAKKTTAFEVSGIVNDDNSQPLAGVLVSVSGRDLSVKSDSAGAFKLDVLSSELLILKRQDLKQSKSL